MKNPVQWFEITTTDVERAKNFYSNVFKLDFQLIEMPDSKLYMFGDTDKTGSAGSLVESKDIKPSTNGTIIYFACEDLSKELTLVEKEGCKILLPKTDTGGFGFYAQFIDTEGNRIGLHSNK